MASNTLPTAKLNTGAEIPMLAYGTGTAHFKSSNLDQIDRKTVESIKTALSLGFYHLDGAEVYNTEAEIGIAIKESSIPREKLFITTKVFTNMTTIPTALETSLIKLGLSYVDLYLIHNPFFTTSALTLQTAWKAMEAVHRSGKARAIGVSNFLRSHLLSILSIATIVPAINQLEYNPYLQREGIVSWSLERGIRTAAYGPLVPIRKARPGPLDAVLEVLTAKYGVCEEAVLLRWTVQMGVVAVTTSGKRERLEGYLQAGGFELTEGEVDEISRVGREKHFRGSHWGFDYGDSRE
ncbi:putative ketoreductase [Mollisia scopiformis]|uniref:Putative ketoreductase n=1 Tax=Mollisia scopiformis TaxID=149040 RepID=A0A194XM19_MOLSC|nr:putative ketoreductase [Mollisia scopiformis]KUJ21129.1 putative ketoreductase [Mollisia scopiformis]